MKSVWLKRFMGRLNIHNTTILNYYKSCRPPTSAAILILYINILRQIARSYSFAQTENPSISVCMNCIINFYYFKNEYQIN